MEEEYLDIDMLCLRIPLAKQTFYNLISKGRLIEGVHYFKPSRKKLVFKWSAMVQWLEGKMPGAISAGERPIDPSEPPVSDSDEPPIGTPADFAGVSQKKPDQPAVGKLKKSKKSSTQRSLIKI